MRIFRRQLIYVQVHQDHFIARLVGGDRTIRRQCHALGNRAGSIKDFSILRPQIKAIFSDHAWVLFRQAVGDSAL